MGGCIADAHALQQALGGIVAANGVAAKQRERHGCGKGVHRQGFQRQGLNDLTDREFGCVGRERGDAKSGDPGAQQQHTNGAHDATGVICDACACGLNETGQRVE